MCEKTHFSKGILRGRFLDSVTTALLALADKVLNGPDSNMFCQTPARYEVAQFFFLLFLDFFQRSRYLFKLNAYKAGVWRDF